LQNPFPLVKKVWEEFFDQVLIKESINRFSVIGYSMGARFALTTLSIYAKQIDNLYLVAPDGLVQGNWYRFATRNKLQRLLFKLVLNSYPLFLKIAKLLSKLGVLNKGLLKFAQVHLQHKEERERIYITWVSFRKLVLAPSELHKITKKYKIGTKIILGNYDRVIPIKRIEPKLITSDFLILIKVYVTHHKLFFYNFLNTAQNSTSKSNDKLNFAT